MSDQFVDLVMAAFAPVVAEFELELLESDDSEWFASVTWHRGSVRLRVSDDRHAQFVQVLVMRPAAAGSTDIELLLGDDVSLPLWAIIEAAGATVPDFGGHARLQRLGTYAAATSDFAGGYLRDPSLPVDVVRRVIRDNLYESSDERRKARRFLP